MILIVGSYHINTANYYKKLNLPQSVLFTGNLSNSTVYHTSIADCQNLSDHLKKFTKVYWAECDQTEFNSYEEYFDTVYTIRDYIRLDPYNIKPNRILIPNTKNSAIFFGCSHTVGQGLDNNDENYVNHVSNHFNLNAINLAKGGAGNYRSFNIFNQFDFYPNQIVILQLTDIARIQFFLDESENQICESQLYKIKNLSYIKVFNDKQLLYMMLDRLELVIKYVREKKLHFTFFNLGDNPNFSTDPEDNFLKKTTEYYLQSYKEYIPNMLTRNVDRGNDNMHFGPKSHKIWADLIIEKINFLYK